ncbi:MAG: hypothetical protein EZS28_009701 [Streblomastix strix]|uniref:RRM domain-containing protein n=1 Tax=Streblomastix strix TaxID=222440 RepID=A0A5J4WJR0_9EUKA|nr:MAG: hypothetical protein EZS28_009701 [Streblomastix strix]
MTTPAKLFIGDLNFKTTEETIRNLFETVGTVNNVKIPKKNGKQLEYGFIEMADVESAKRALSQLDGHELNGRRIKRDPNSQHDLGTRIPELIILIMKERIFQIIHLNCPPEINCQQCINVPQSPTLIELKSATFQTLNDVSKYNQGFKGMLQKDLNFVLHLTHILIWFASQYQFIKETNSQEQNNQQLQESSSSLSLIASSLNLLSNLIRDNDNIRQTVIKTANFLYSLTTLTMCQLGIHFNQQYDLQAFTIRISSRSCLCSIRSNGDASDHTELANAGYYNALIFAFSTAGGVGEEQDEEIGWNLDYIFKFLRSLNLGTHSLPHQLIPLLFKRIFEQVEEEGGNEEVDSQLINRGYGQSRNSMEYMASRTRGAILNFYIDLSTREPRWYY